MSLAFELSLAEGIVGWAFMLSKVAVGSEHWSARDCVSLTGLACKGLSVPGRRHSGVGLHVEQSGDVEVLAVKGLRVPGRGVVELACKGAVCSWPACFAVADVGGAFGVALELMNSEHEELVLHVELLLPLRQR